MFGAGLTVWQDLSLPFREMIVQ